MIHLYPANKMESLLALFDKIQQLSPLPVFAQETIIVQNAGMQHWLNLAIAEKQKIAFNHSYALPAQFLWKLVKLSAGEEDGTNQEPFSREALCWRIDAILASDEVLNDQDFYDANQYWCIGGADSLLDENQVLKRFQLACQVADLFEQYLVFRPDWIELWHNNESCFKTEDDSLKNLELWQRKIWQKLTQETSYNPLALVEKAIENLANQAIELPKRISFFGINSLAPIWLKLLNALSAHTQIHFFHLNPSINYWGDIVTEKQAFSLLSRWTNNHQDISELVGNSLLANFGQQGREFLAQLQDYSTISVDVFEENVTPNNDENSLLHRLQNDIFNVENPLPNHSEMINDGSLIVSSAHSALREVQGLHDWLLHRFNDDSSLTPKDVLVMCPKIEDYAAYVNAVFAPGWQNIGDDIPPLPCSIADRVSKEAEPIVAAFSEILSLPDSRFQVNQILSWLRIEQVQLKYSLVETDVAKLIVWLEHAKVHWGIDEHHKSSVTGSKSSNSYTWQQGLSRLMRGFSFADQESIVNDQLLLPDVEGSDVELLGKLMTIIEDIQYCQEQLKKPRTVEKWHDYLKDMLALFFVDDGSYAFTIIHNAVDELLEYCTHANYLNDISHKVLTEFLNNHFSQPDPGRHFMVGQITFCSMLPMRSIPFKVIAVLGLNDGEFPRQRLPFDFDLMSKSEFRQGDRSRRADDRYLFLEALISAREALYLSYQGRNIKNNKVKQPSIVLVELLSYLSKYYGWSSLGEAEKKPEESAIRQLPMQAFSQQNYLGDYASFDSKWLSLVKSSQNQVDLKLVDSDVVFSSSLNLLIKFFHHPCKYFANNSLGLYLENYDIVLEDVEPFKTNFLDGYQFREDMLAQNFIANDCESTLNALQESIKRSYLLSDRLPEAPLVSEQLDDWTNDSDNFHQFIQEDTNNVISSLDLTLLIPAEKLMSDNEFTLSLVVDICDNKAIYYRSSSAKGKDQLRLYITQLILQVAQEFPELIVSDKNDDFLCQLQRLSSTNGYYFDTKSQKSSLLIASNIEHAYHQLIELLNAFILGHQKPLLLNVDLANKLLTSKVFEQNDLASFWQGDKQTAGFCEDGYVRYFWPQCPELEEISSSIESIYKPMVQHVEKVKK